MSYLWEKDKLHLIETWKEDSIYKAPKILKPYHPYRQLKKAFNGENEIEVVNLGTSEEKKEVKIGTCVSANVRDELVALLWDYQDIFAWSYQDMPSLSSEIVQHRLPLNYVCSPIKQKFRRMKPKMSLKIKEEVKKQFDVGCWSSPSTQNGLPILC